MVSQAMIIGRSHRLMQRNGQDFAMSGAPRPGVAFGLVLDGCGGKVGKLRSQNEVGAQLLGRFAGNWLAEELTIGNGQLSIVNVVDGLYEACVRFLADLTGLVGFVDEVERSAFVASHLLATMVGFVVTDETAVFFWQGDGYLVHNGIVTELDSANQPDYLAYRVLGGGENGRFQTKIIPNDEKLEWLAVATDGWQPELLAGMSEPRSSLMLQRWLNVQARQSGAFEDDGAVAIWRRKTLDVSRIF